MKYIINFIAVIILSLIIINPPVYAAEAGIDGSLNHSVDIKLPPGTAGLAPKLSLTYNSNAGNGMMGQGWSLQGLPVITRDSRVGIKYDGTDTYTGSNGRLIIQTGDVYHFEYENYSKIQKFGTAGDGPAYWVETKSDGTKYYYGNYGGREDANILAIGQNGSVRVWALSKVEDVHNNYYEVRYGKDNDNGEYYPKKIVYTCGHNISTMRTVEFEYDNTRSDYWPGYEQSAMVETTGLLKRIVVRTNVYTINILGLFEIGIWSDIVRKYELEYTGGTSGIDPSRLVKISEFGGDGNLVDYSSFTWSDGSTFATQLSLSLTSPVANRIYSQAACNECTDSISTGTTFSGDINGDGRIDIINIPELSNSFTTANVYAIHGSIQTPTTLSYSWNTYTAPYIHLTSSIFTADFNGDGKSDIGWINLPTGSPGELTSYCDEFGGCSYNPFFLINIDYSSGLTFTRQVIPDRILTGYNDKVLVGDYNGDGRTDLGYSSGNKEYIGYSTGTSFTWASYSKSIDADDSVITGDFNGDGKTDICYSDYEHDYLHIGYSTGTGFTWKDYSRSIDKNDRIITGDFNGDGKTDICYSDYEHDYLHIGYSTGSGFTWKEYSRSIDKNDSIITGDFNGDGKTDICYSDYEHKYLHVGCSTGNGFVWISSQCSINASYWTGISDIDGDGRDELIVWNDTVFKAYKIQLKPAYITKVTKRAGSSVDIGYTQATMHQAAIDPTDSTYPKIANKSPRQLVTSITVSDGKGASYAKNYVYTKGKLLMGLPVDRKNLYFKTIAETDTTTGIVTTTEYEQDDVWLAGNPVKVVKKSGSTILEEDVYTYNKNSTGTQFTGTHFVKLLAQSSKTYEGGAPAYTKSKIITFDDYGNPSIITDHADGTPDITSSMTYAYDFDLNILNRPLNITKTSSGSIIQGTTYAYSGVKLTAMNTYLNGSYIPTGYEMDNTGNIVSITDTMNHTTLIEYDSNYKTFVSKVTNPHGHIVTMQYDGLGNMTSKTDQNGNTTENEYDGAGRLIAVTDANGDVVKMIDYHDELLGSVGSQHIETKLKNDSTGTYSVTKSYFDGLGRVIRTESDAGTADGAMLVKVEDVQFDSAGRILKKSLPYIQGKQNALYITYQYDIAGKVIQETIPDSETSTVIYTTAYSAISNCIEVTKTDPRSKVWKSRYDSRGKLVKKSEPEGAEVSYSYDASGRLTGTVDAGNKVTSITYDTLGRKLMISDPNVGTISYSYDNAGNMLTKTDNSGDITTYTYDSLNRLLTIDYPGTTPDVNYTYDETSMAYGKGKVTTVSDGVTVCKYGYDKNGNAEYMRQTVENIDFIFVMEYDSQKRLASITYPDGVKVDNEYSEGGYLRAVKQGSGAYVQYGLKKDDGGSYANKIRRLTGNNVETVIDFNPANHRPKNVVSKNAANVTLENNTYTYDGVGNILSITDTLDSSNPKIQTFTYDGLNRLKTASGSYDPQTFEYTASGNMTQNSHGTLQYNDSNHPYAVTGDGQGNTYTYDDNGNMISGKNRTMEYDGAGRLAVLKKNGSNLHVNKYDHTGHRVLQQRAGGVVIYNIAGLYELVKAPDRADHHTKYIYGMEGDLAAQVTTTGTTLVGANFNKGWLFDKGYGGNPMMSLLARGYIKADRFFSKAGNMLKIQNGFAILLFAALLLALARTGLGGRMRQMKQKARPIWSGAMSFVLVIALIGSFSLTGCYDIVPMIGGGGASDTTDTGGLPTLGTFYFHPDHIGSVSYLTDSNGAVVTRMSYTPYGEKTKTGPDIFHQKYTGQVDDGDDAGLMYYKARYYDPALGRFITADSVIPGADKTQAYNRYMYVVGNPITYSDPTGHFSFKKFGKILKGASISFLIGGIPATSAYILGGTHGQPWKGSKWEHFDNKRAKEAAIITIAVEVIILATILAPGPGTALVSGGINAYFTCRDGGSLQDIIVSFTIGYTVACLMPVYSDTPLMDAMITGAARGAITNGLTQSYNMTLGQKTHQEKFNVRGFALSIGTGAVSGALESWGGLTEFREIDAETRIGFYGATSIASVMDIKTFSILAIGMEESIYWTQRQND